jgi:predicted RND superfamily exporter protein
MLATSSTTAVAFLANYLSPIMPIASFGIFVAIIIPVNYILVVFLVPSITIIYENYIKKYEQVKCCRKLT